MAFNPQAYQINDGSIAYKASISLSALVTAAILGWLLWRSHFGIDFTDEGFYLVWISNPWLYRGSQSLFGFIYHPLYELLNGNIVWLRQSNVVVTFALAWWLCVNFFRQIYESPNVSNRPYSLDNMIIAAAFATSSFMLFKWWLVTPSYNSLALQALLLAGSGLLLAEKKESKSSLVGWTLIGVAGWLAFMAKPTTAAALALVTAIYLLIADKIRLRFIAISVVTTIILLLASAWVIGGSIALFIEYLKTGNKVFQILVGENNFDNLFRWDIYALTPMENHLIQASTLFVFISICLLYVKRKPVSLIGYGLLLIPILISLSTITSTYMPKIAPTQFLGLLVLAAPLGTLAASIVIVRTNLLTQISRKAWAHALCFIALPYAYAFGTGNNYWVMMPIAAIFWVLAGLILLAPETPTLSTCRLLLPIAAAVQLTTVITVNTAMENPYRQPQPLRQNNHITEIGAEGGKLILSQSYADYFRSLRAIAKNAGFRANTPIIDMTGHAPTSLFAIGGKSLGAAWILGGYKGSDRYAVARLNQASCNEIASAWLLIEPNGPLKISSRILSHFGINIGQDFSTAGKIITPIGAGGFQKPQEQFLLKPSRSISDARLACEQSKVKAIQQFN